MTEDLDLTTTASEKKWYSKRWFWYLVLALVLCCIALAVFLKAFSVNKAEQEYGEDQLPAIKVVILNGCGYEQLAAEFAAALSHKNIDVISLGDTPRPIYDKSIIVVRRGDMHDLERLQKMTGIERWTSALNEYHSADFDIIVGRDYESFIK